jgi:hypothetical protein
MWEMIEQVNPDALDVVVVEDGAEIVGCWGLITLAHVEGIWIRPDHQKRGVVLRKLWRAMRHLTTQRNIERVITGADTTDVAEILTAMHAQPMGRQFLLPMTRIV